MGDRMRLVELLHDATHGYFAQPDRNRTMHEYMADYLIAHGVIVFGLPELALSGLALPAELRVDRFSLLWLLSAPGRSLEKCPKCGTFYANHLGHACVPLPKLQQEK